MEVAFSSLLGLIACPAKLALSVAKLVRPAVEITEPDISDSLAGWFAAGAWPDASACFASSLAVVAWLD